MQMVFSLIQIYKNKLNISYWYDFTYKKALVTLEQGMLDSAERDDQQTQRDQHCWMFWAVILQWALYERSYQASKNVLGGHPPSTLNLMSTVMVLGLEL